MMKKSWKNRSAVSPVIATILMVAITVVLAAVLYVMVMGFGDSTPSAPTAQLTKNTSGNYEVSISGATHFANMRYIVNGTGAADMTQAAGRTVTFTDGSHSVTVAFVDAGGDSKVTSGDYFTVSKTGDNSFTYTLNLIWINYGTSQSLWSITI